MESAGGCFQNRLQINEEVLSGMQLGNPMQLHGLFGFVGRSPIKSCSSSTPFSCQKYLVKVKTKSRDPLWPYNSRATL